jgi:hypothetical protein
VIRSKLGRADTTLVAKAARLAGVTVERFWAGQATGQDHGASRAAPRRSSVTRDRITSLVLSIHAAADRPLGLAQVVELSGRRVTCAQVRAASAQLCREGHLDRIRPGVYQWSARVRALRSAARQHPPRDPHRVPARAAASPGSPGHATQHCPGAAAQLFGQLIPGGVGMTAEVLAVFEQWTELTERLITYATPS